MKLRLFKNIFIFHSIFFMMGCAHYDEGTVLRETPLGISETRKVMTTIFGEPRYISQNGREMTSQFYDTKGRFGTFEKERSRLYTHIVILGERRPYDIQVMVKVQARNGGKFQDVAIDERRSQEAAEKIQQALNESRDKRNFIDDFKPF
jgi:hypothetical protein